MPSRSWKTSTWPSVAGPAPIPITGISSFGISASVTADGIASKTIAKQPTDCRASASSASLAAASAVRPWALKPPRAVAVCGVRPTWPITGMPERTIARARSTEGPPRSSLTASTPRLLDEALGVLDRLLVGALVGAEGHVADQQRRLQPAADGAGHHQHLVHADRGGRVVAEDDHRGGVADQDDVDAGLLGDLGRGIVVGGDHHDRLAVALHLRDPREGHRARSVARRRWLLRWARAHSSASWSGLPSASRTDGSLSTAVTSLSSSTWTTTGE